MKTLAFLSAFLLVGACATQSHKEKIQSIKDSVQIIEQKDVLEYSNTITINELKSHLYFLASDRFEGRSTGSKGQKLAAEFLRRYYEKESIPAPNGGDYFQHINGSYFGQGYEDTENVYAYVEGTEKPDEVLVISAHYDHMGIRNDGSTYYGADDDASGTVALMEMAQAFKLAKEAGKGPKRSVLFLHTTAEEIGLQGSQYYTENPAFPLEQTIANLNIDMIGRVDTYYERNGKSDYLYLIGADRLSTELHFINEAVNDTYFDLELNYKFNEEDDRNRYYYRSDHYNFARKDIPVVFYFNGEHADYHRVSDTPDKIDYKLLTKRTRFIFATAWQLANQEHRLSIDKT